MSLISGSMFTKNDLIKTLEAQGINNPKVLHAMRTVPRELFVLPSTKNKAYANVALPIDYSQTISQPFIVALMTQVLLEHPHPKIVLEIGTGSGYQTAILGMLFKEVCTIERIPELSIQAKTQLDSLGYSNIQYKVGDGKEGWVDKAPFDAIIVTAAALDVPPLLMAQLSEDQGLMIIPLGMHSDVQVLTKLEKNGSVIQSKPLEYVTFVPLVS
jgi:protein-L-isoaspartate(D-aspartate) O-methyltransferase